MAVMEIMENTVGIMVVGRDDIRLEAVVVTVDIHLLADMADMADMVDMGYLTALWTVYINQ